MTKKAVDKDLKRFVQLERATLSVGRRNINLGLGLLFLVAVWIFASFHHTGTEGSIVLIVAAVIGGYMALNIGANDVANNMGPAVGGKVLTVLSAVLIAAVCESAGALLAGGGSGTPPWVRAKRIFLLQTLCFTVKTEATKTSTNPRVGTLQSLE